MAQLPWLCCNRGAGAYLHFITNDKKSGSFICRERYTYFLNMQAKQRNNLPPQAEKNRDRLKNARDVASLRKEQQIDNMSSEEVKNELKEKNLPVFGTAKERVDRLKKALGIPITTDGGAKKNNVLENIDAIQRRREERRKRMEEEKLAKEERKAGNEAMGRLVDLDFENMIILYRQQVPPLDPHIKASELRICVCVRKRPIFQKEETNGEIDAVSVSNPSVLVHEPKLKVDGITKYLENHQYTFDNSFSEKDDTTLVYEYSLRPLCPFILSQGTVTCFAYGQTGSGKTFTMKGLQAMVVEDLFNMTRGQCMFHISFFEIYGGRCYDLLDGRAKLSILEDGSGNIQIHGLTDHKTNTSEEVHALIEYGNSIRTTHATASNEDSSRSHAICQIVIRSGNAVIGRLRLVDLAGSERAGDCTSNNRQRRIEGAEINKSLLALKECVRALRRGPDAHIPYRCSKLTLVLKDSFEGSYNNTRVLMITCISPGHSSSDHTLNSLRYADRLKEQSAGNVVNQFQPKAEVKFPKPSVSEPPPPQTVPASQAGPRKPQPAVPQPSSQAPSQPKREQKRKESVTKLPQARENLKRSIKDIEYINKIAEDDKLSAEMLDFHEKVETILEEEEELLEIHVNAIKEDAQMLTEEGELIAMAQGEGSIDYDIDSYVLRMEILVKHKLAVYQQLYQKLKTFKAHLNEEEEFSHHMTHNYAKNK